MNVQLSFEEKALVTEAGFIYTKNRIIQKVYGLFGVLSEEYKQLTNSIYSENISVGAKISKGENYQGLPWVMLDYPRLFSKDDVFAIRSFFWWGNFFSITLQLQGKYKTSYSPFLKHFSNTGWWICNDKSDAWQHHFDKDYYVLFDDNVQLDELPFIKLAKKIPLNEWDKAFEFFTGNFKKIIEVLSTQPVK